MKLLIDENISWRIVKPLQEFYPDTIHVNRTNIAQPSKDTLIWEYAKKNNFIIVTNDEDFIDLLTLKGLMKLKLVCMDIEIRKYLSDIEVAISSIDIHLQHKRDFNLYQSNITIKCAV